MTIVTLYALFGDDVRLLAFSKTADDYFNATTTVCLVFFALELILSSLSKPGYLNSFYFWLDLIATISLIPDIGFMWNPLIGIDEEDSGSTDTD